MAQFFLGATTAVFANVRGGILAAVIAAFLNGVIITLTPVVFYAANWVPQENGRFVTSVWGDTDYLIAALPGLLVLPQGAVGRALVLSVPLIIWIGLVIDGQINKFRNKNKADLVPITNQT